MPSWAEIGPVVLEKIFKFRRSISFVSPLGTGYGPSVIRFVCLFVWVFVPPENFSSIWRRTLRSEASLTCYTYCDTGLPFITVISENS